MSIPSLTGFFRALFNWKVKLYQQRNPECLEDMIQWKKWQILTFQYFLFCPCQLSFGCGFPLEPTTQAQPTPMLAVEKEKQRIMTITTNAMSNLNKLVSFNNRMVSVEWCQHSTLTKKPLSNMVAKSLSILNWIPLRLRAVLFIKAILPFAIMLDALKWEKYLGDIVKLQTD